MSRPAREFGDGPLPRAAGVAYWFLVIEGLLVLTTAPAFVPVLFLAQDPSNLPFYALALIPVGPALAAALYAWRVFLRERDPSPAAHFWKGYRVNLADSLKAWVPALLLLTILATNIAFGGAVGITGMLAAVFVGLGLLILLWSLRMIVITSAYSFRWRDAARVAAFTLTARPMATLGLVSLLVLAAGIALFTFDAVVVLLASVLTYFLARNEAPVLALVKERFVAAEDGTPTP